MTLRDRRRGGLARGRADARLVNSEMQKYSTVIPGTAAELFDGELVIAHYGSGFYYSISESGALIWQGLRHGLADSEVIDWLAGHYPAQGEEVRNLVPEFIARMREHGLLIPESTVTVGADLPVLNGGRFETPVLEQFDDLQELLLVDPVHEVDSTGWPRRAEDQPR
jgi:hypothetical protein